MEALVPCFLLEDDFPLPEEEDLAFPDAAADEAASVVAGLDNAADFLNVVEPAAASTGAATDDSKRVTDDEEEA